VGLANVARIAGGGWHPLVLESDGRPCITVQPLSQSVSPGAPVRLLAMAVGLPSLTYQWQHNGTNLPGATGCPLTLGEVRCPDAGAYALVVSNQIGSAVSSTATLTIFDTTPPTITCPPDVTAYADPGTGAATNVALGTPATGDNCAVATVTNNALPSYPQGTNVVTWTVTDASGNTNSCEQRVVVVQSPSPTIVWYLTNLVLAADTNCQALLPDLTGTNYIIATSLSGSVTVTQSVAADTLLGLGAVEVVLGAFDNAGSVMYCTNSVLVADQTPPSVFCPGDLSVTNDPGQCGAVVSYAAPTAQDNCSGATPSQTGGLPSGALFPPGRTTNTFKATDGAGNSAERSFVVTVVDAEPPVVTWHSTTVSVAVVTNCQGVMPDITGTNDLRAADNCGSITMAQSVAAGTLLSLGTNEVVLGISDAAGNTVYCTNYVVVEDLAPPTLVSGPADQAVALGQDAAFCVSATNHCGGEPVYQWRFQGIDIPGATSNCFSLTSLRLSNAGPYEVVVSNLAAAITSPAAVLNVVGPYLSVDVEALSTGESGRTNFIFVYPSVTGLDYVVEYSDAVAESNLWLPLLTNTGTGGLITNDLPIGSDPPGRFYRVLVP
jgi:hypothetical protein